MLSSASSATESTDLATGPGTQAPPAARPEPQFSELIDRWLEEGDRLNQQAATVELPAAPSSRLAIWRQRGIELGRTVLERHRLELLVGIGLLPLTLFLIAQSGGQRAPGAARRVPAAAVPARAAVQPARAAAAPAPRAPAVAPILLSEGLLRQCTAGPAVHAPKTALRPTAHRHKPVAPRTASAAAPAKPARQPPPAPHRQPPAPHLQAIVSHPPPPVRAPLPAPRLQLPAAQQKPAAAHQPPPAARQPPPVVRRR